VGSSKVVIIWDETKGFPAPQPLSSFFAQLGFTSQTIIKGDFVLGGFELHRDLSFCTPGEVRDKTNQLHGLQPDERERGEGTSSRERKGISTGGFPLEPLEAFPASVLRPI